MSTFDDLQVALGTGYRLDRELGGGGMSRVFLADDLALRRQVVLKVLPSELAGVVHLERFNRETLLLARLQHPHIVPVLNVGSLHGLPWFSMPYIEGESLRARIDRVPELPIADVVSVLRDVAKALAYAHERGIIHRDIKPDNILLTGDAATVADFGIAKAVSSARAETHGDALTQIGIAIGTPAYMSPEQAAGSDAIDQRSDLYALGCVAYEMLSGTAPFAGRPFQRQLVAQITETVPPISERRSGIPPALASLVMQCLAKDPALRPQEARDMVLALEQTDVRSGEIPQATSSVTSVWRAIVTWGAAVVVLGLVAKVATSSIGLPTWVFPATLLITALGLPLILVTGFVQRVARANATTITSATAYASSPSASASASDTAPTRLSRAALAASPHLTWARVEKGSIAVIGAFALMIAGFMGLRAMGVGPAGSLQASGAFADHERLVMTDFSVRGADTLLGRVASDAVRAGLVQSGALTLLTPTEIGEALTRMQRPRDSRLALDLMRDVATREGVRAIVDGELTAVGSSYILAVRLVTADSGRELASYRATAESPDRLIQMADELSRKLRARIGESLRVVNATPPLERVTTSSLEALRRYSAGVRAADVEGNTLRAAELFREAVAIDTLFAEGWRRLGLLLANMTAAPGAADSALSKAYQLRGRLTEIDAERVTASYFAAGTHADRVKAIQAFERVLALGDSSVLGNLAGRYESRREFARAEVLRRLVVQRDSGVLRLSALRSNLFLQGHWSGVDSIEAIVRRRFPKDNLNSAWARTRAQLSGDLPLYRRLVDSAVVEGDARDPVQTANRQMMLALTEGRLRDADRFRGVSLATYRAQGVPIDAFTASYMSLESTIDAGAPVSEALRDFEAARAGAPPTSRVAASLAAARVYAKLGMASRMKEALADFDRSVSDSTARKRYADSRMAIVTELAMAEGRWAQAVASARRADQEADGPATNCVECLSLELLRVFAEQGVADSALAQYDAYRRTPYGMRPRVGPDLTVPARTMLALARIYEARGDARNAAAAYRDYATRYERADADLQPSVRDARARMQALLPAESLRR
ncbi:serine/threonine-protein kinase [Gemmatimonas groenlandica]|uniref:non-specific serine/threonine protein kinase n=1 Tax=Gemmatimonas groenlandica TaxID=2732249 RepID=A0A6M4IQM8_9BACT|nr:serine/threonine-protein kinase [Gemmatimonas groenlandica]QJR35787.1 protein kinase [Gemmatimonas groenlandica]